LGPAPPLPGELAAVPTERLLELLAQVGTSEHGPAVVEVDPAHSYPRMRAHVEAVVSTVPAAGHRELVHLGRIGATTPGLDGRVEPWRRAPGPSLRSAQPSLRPLVPAVRSIRTVGSTPR